ncbi:MAG: HoxN/HupN/NixA family nickel/cobalt transporter [Deltaproteobacteria bacterium]|jgi:high-affinity nickel-transport protein|nr:HoxN/HupN/NixA family nickel/cobalt transporter [Deltaproteobacteria bacterium]MCL5879926.1 HoxN/HupN/NixA family nickel/cobalt transporter [Deltaproteobacteria bacterium]MDA8304327.1 HoxN/HupN/NixA family nickel/cobalt transporter [Deltaproteobacteria bacterium]
MFIKKDVFNSKPLKFKIIFLYSFLVLFIIVCWAVLFYLSYSDMQFLALGSLAFLLGLKHAMDADHITAIDNVTRKLVNDGKKQVGVGLFFSLGHSTIVLIMAIVFVISASFISANINWLGHIGAILGASVSALFLYIIALMNITVLISIIKTYRDIKAKKASNKEIEEEMSKLGFMNRFFKKFYNSINSSYQMYPVGVLFGLGFDTATEVLLLGITVSAALNEKSILVVLILPFLFASGMMFLDSTDSVIMLFAYKWAFINPIRKIKYNISLTTLSVVLALLIGTIEWFQVLALEAGYKKGFIGALLHLSFSAIGAAIAVLFIVIWGVYILINKAGLVNQDR